MKKNKLAEIKNRTAYIHNLLVELEDVIKEAELDEVLNTSKEGHKTLNDAPLLAGSVVNELDDYEEITKGWNHSFTRFWLVGTIVILSVTVLYLLTE